MLGTPFHTLLQLGGGPYLLLLVLTPPLPPESLQMSCPEDERKEDQRGLWRPDPKLEASQGVVPG